MFKSAKYIALEKSITILIGFLISMMLMRYLGPVGNAHISQALGLSYLLGSIAKFGLDDVLQQRHQSSDHSSIYSVLILIFERVTILSVLTIFFFAFDIYGRVFSGTNKELLLALLIFSGVISFDFGIHFLRGMKKNSFNNIIMSLNSIILLTLTSYGIYSQKNLSYFIYSYCFALGIAHFVAFYISSKMSAKKYYKNIKIPLKVKIHMLLNAGLAMLYFRMDAILLPIVSDAYNAGRYLAAQKTADIIPGSFVVFASVALPWIKNAMERDDLLKLLSALVQVTTLLSLLAISIIYLIYDKLLITIIGNEYIGTSNLILIFGLSLPSLIFAAYTDVVYILRKNYTIILLKTAIAVMLKMTLFTLTPETTNISTFAFYSVFSATCATILVCWFVDRAIIHSFLEIFRLQRLSLNITYIMRNTRD